MITLLAYASEPIMVLHTEHVVTILGVAFVFGLGGVLVGYNRGWAEGYIAGEETEENDTK